MIPVINSFEYFLALFPLLLVLGPLLAVTRRPVGRRLAIMLSGTYLLFLIAPRLALFHLLLWLLIAGLQPIVQATGERRSGLWVLTGALLVPFVPVVIWKIWPVATIVKFNVWTHEIITWFGAPLAAADFAANLVVPVGLSFSAFRAGDLLIKSNLGLIDRLRVDQVLAYGLFAPILVVGPIAEYSEIRPTIDGHVPIDARRGVDALLHIVSGLARVWVLTAPLQWTTTIVADAPYNGAVTLWISLVLYTIYFYINFSGYAAIAVGIGRLMGADVKENFSRPFSRTDPSAFWNSWHISLTRFLRSNVFVPIAAGRPNRQTLATMSTLMLVALWHGVNLPAVVFGLYHGGSLVAHRALSARRPADASPALWKRVAKSLAIVVWFSLSAPLIDMTTSEMLDFYPSLVFGGAELP